MSTDDLRQELYLIADELSGAGTLATRFGQNVYERERGHLMLMQSDRLRKLADGENDQQLTDVPFDDEAARRVSPAVGVEAVVLDEDGRVLLARRRDDHTWCLPGGLCEIGQSPSEAVLRELWEEAGIRGEVYRLLGVFDGRSWGARSTVHLIHLVFLIRAADMDPEPGIEMIETAYFGPDALPSDFHPGHDLRVPYCFDLVRSGGTHHDPDSTLTGSLPMHQRPESTA